MITRRSLVWGAGAASLVLGRDAAAAEPSCSDAIVLVDSTTEGRREYASGPYLAFQAVNNRTLPREQSLTVCPHTFPAGARIDWSWPDRADESAKGWNAVDFGDYLNTHPPEPVRPARIDAIERLTVGTAMTYRAQPESANATIDLFLYRTPTSGIPDMACEIQIYLHAPASTRRFIDRLEPLGTYVPPAAEGGSGLRWTAALQASNFFRTPYFLFYPADGSDHLALDFDLKALLDWLRAPNAVTGRRHLTGAEFFTGLGVGIEPIKGKGSAVIERLAVDYNPGA